MCETNCNKKFSTKWRFFEKNCRKYAVFQNFGFVGVIIKIIDRLSWKLIFGLILTWEIQWNQNYSDPISIFGVINTQKVPGDFWRTLYLYQINQFNQSNSHEINQSINQVVTSFCQSTNQVVYIQIIQPNKLSNIPINQSIK